MDAFQACELRLNRLCVCCAMPSPRPTNSASAPLMGHLPRQRKTNALLCSLDHGSRRTDPGLANARASTSTMTPTFTSEIVARVRVECRSVVGPSPGPRIGPGDKASERHREPAPKALPYSYTFMARCVGQSAMLISLVGKYRLTLFCRRSVRSIMDQIFAVPRNWSRVQDTRERK